jgi:hypothetical protein
MFISYENRERIEYIFWVIIILGGISGGGYLIYSHRDITTPLKNETHCAQFIYFDSTSHKMDTGYYPVTMYDDSIVNITTSKGTVWWANNFVDNQEIIIDETLARDITLKNGDRYKIIPLDSGRCQSKTIMDSIRGTYPIQNNNGDNN